MPAKFTSRMVANIYSLLALLSFLGVIETVLVRGFMFPETSILQIITHAGYIALIVLYLIWTVGSFVKSGWNVRKMFVDIFLSLVLLGMVFPVYIGGSIVSFRIILSLLTVFFRTTGITTLLEIIRINPARLLLLSFFGGIMVGTLLLMLPASTTDYQGASFIDAFFTSSSALCVTGLTVKDTGTYFSGFGQMVILILIQTGGLGIMTLSTLYTILLGRRLGWKQEEHIREIMESTTAPQMYRLVVNIVSITLFFEFIGSIILYFHWLPVMGSFQATWNALFHCISAFCNAGFSLFPDNLMGSVGDFTVNSVIMILIVFGGLGFIVIEDIIANTRRFNPLTIRWSRLKVHTRLVIITTLILIVSGTLILFFFEFDNTMLHLSTFDKLQSALFQSITCRTAGYNTLDITAFQDVSLFICILLMFIGASPASTAGGIKTSTLAVLILSVRTLLNARDKVEVYNRSIPNQTVYKSVAILLFSTSFIIIFTVLLLVTQKGEFLRIIFEAVSAIGTVGLTAGVTPHLDSTGKLLISILMYVGRVGPLTIALALGESRKVTVEYPSTRIVVG
jgi:trk system potassium uptake protein